MLAGFGVIFMAVGVWAWQTTPSNANNVNLIAPMFIGGAIMLSAGIALMSCGWGCGSYGGYCGPGGGCDCGHCDGCKGDSCCGDCACVKDDGHGHEHGHEGHSH